MKVEASLLSVDIEYYAVSVRAIPIYGYANVGVQCRPKNDYESIIIEVGRVIDNVRIVDVEIQSEVPKLKVHQVSERGESEILGRRSTCPVVARTISENSRSLSAKCL